MPPQPSMPFLEGVFVEGQVGNLVATTDVVAVGDATFGGPRIFVHAPWFEWRPEVHVQG